MCESNNSCSIFLVIVLITVLLLAYLTLIIQGLRQRNDFYSIMLAHDAIGRYWWYGSRHRTFPAVLYYILLPCDRWQQKGSWTEWKCVWSKSVKLHYSMQKKIYLWTVIDTCWIFMVTSQRMLAEWGGGWCVSVVVTVMWKTKDILDGHAQLTYHKMKSILISSCMQFGRFQLRNYGCNQGTMVQSWILASVHWKQW